MHPPQWLLGISEAKYVKHPSQPMLNSKQDCSCGKHGLSSLFPSSCSFPCPTFILTLGQLSAGPGLGPTAAGLLGLCKMPSEWGLSVSLVLRPFGYCGGYVCVPGILGLVAAPPPLPIRTVRSYKDKAGSLCPASCPRSPFRQMLSRLASCFMWSFPGKQEAEQRVWGP